MFCPNCGSEINDNARICMKCGCAVGGAAPYAGAVQPAKISNNIGLAIFSLLCCCMPFGIVSLIFSCKVADLERSGRIEEAQKAADDAKKYALIGIVLGFVVNVAYFFLCVLDGLTENM